MTAFTRTTSTRSTIAGERRRSYDRATFRREAAAAGNLSDLCRALGLAPRGANYSTVRSFAAQHDIDIEHLEAAIRRRRDLTHAELHHAVRGARTRAEILARLGERPTSGAYRWLRNQASALSVPIDVRGRGWSAGSPELSRSHAHVPRA